MGYELQATKNGGVPQIQWNDETVALLKSTICKGATDDELKYAVMVCQRMGLDPFSKQIWCIKRWSASEKKEVLAFQTSIDGYRICAQRTGLYNGREAPQWCGEDGIWRDVWLSTMPPAAAKISVYRKGFDRPVTAVAMWSEYRQTKQDGSTNSMWTKMPALMLAKCAEALALRTAFPYEMSGVYTAEEQENNELKDVTPVDQRPKQAQRPTQQPALKNAAPPKTKTIRPYEVELEHEIAEWMAATGKNKLEWGKTFAAGQTWGQLDCKKVLDAMLAIKNATTTSPAEDLTPPDDFPAFSQKETIQ